MRIELINSNQGLITGPMKIMNKLYNEFSIKHPNYFQIMIHQKKRGGNSWDGFIKLIDARGKFDIGLLPTIVNRLKELKEKVIVIDSRESNKVIPIIPRSINGITLREAQVNAIKSLIHNKVCGVPYYIGVQDMSVGSGKSLTMAGIHLAFNGEYKTLILLNDSDLFNQFKTEFPNYLGKDIPITFIQGNKVQNWSMFNIAMVQSLSRNIQKYQHEMSKVDIVLVDECDLATSKTYTNVIKHMYNTKVRVGLSGTVYMSKLKKDILKNMTIRRFFGDVLSTVKLHEMIRKGYSTPVIVKMVPGPGPNKLFSDYRDVYDDTITTNKKAYELSLKRTLWNVKQGRLPALVVTKYIMHCENLYKFYKEQLEGKYSIEHVHHEVKDRDDIISRFREGKIDILISTTIIARGKNLPLLRYLQNTSSMDSNEKAIQLLGRLVRTHESKSKTYLDDIMFLGKYLSRHAKHRKNYYINQKLRVIDLSKKKRKK